MYILLGFLIILSGVGVIWGINWLLNKFDVDLESSIVVILCLILIGIISWFFGIIGCGIFPNLVPFCSAG
jgi:hypothetical protein